MAASSHVSSSSITTHTTQTHKSSSALLLSCQEMQSAYQQAAKDLETAYRPHAAQATPHTQSVYNKCVTTYLEIHEQLLTAITAYKPHNAAQAEKMEKAVAHLHGIAQTKILSHETTERTAEDLFKELHQENQKYLSHTQKIKELIKKPELAHIHYGYYLNSLASQRKTISNILLLAKQSQTPTATSFAASARAHLQRIEEYHQQFSKVIEPRLPKIKDALNLSFDLTAYASLPALSTLYAETSKKYSEKVTAMNQANREKNIPSIIENYNQSCQLHTFKKKILKRILQLTQDTLYNQNSPFYKAQLEWEKITTYHNTATNTLLTQFPMIAPAINYGSPMCSAAGLWTADEINLFTENELWAPAFLSLQHDYPFRRTIRGDGNCFYTSLLVAYLSTPAHIAHFWNLINNAPDEISSKSLAQEIIAPLMSDPTKEIDWSHHQNILPLVHLMRQLIARELEKEIAQYGWDAQHDGLSPEAYLKSKIIRMGAFSREPAIAASSTLLNFPFEIMDFEHINESIDESGTIRPTISQYPKDDPITPQATLIIKSNHYFILYKTDPSPVKDLLQF